jgi:uncharacterized protein
MATRGGGWWRRQNRHPVLRLVDLSVATPGANGVDSQPLLIVGASARAAAFSALRAELQPCCIDLFADADLQARCSVRRLSLKRYPSGFAEAAATACAGPWLYTGGLENYPRALERISRSRLLWGNGPAVLRIVRSPRAVNEILRRAGMPCPAYRRTSSDDALARGWLVKPLKSSGGVGIRHWNGAPLVTRGSRREYLQEFIEGDACSAVFVGSGRGSQLVGVSRQLIGEKWLHVDRFHYCGSIGPMKPSLELNRQLQAIGGVLCEAAGLRGLFGVDFIRQADKAYPVEINPRYTASVEILEHTLGVVALALHCAAFDRAIEQAPPADDRPQIAAKAILFARRALSFPREGPWLNGLQPPGSPWEFPAFADIPRAGERIERGRPVITCFAHGASEAECLQRLQQTAADLDRCLFGA